MSIARNRPRLEDEREKQEDVADIELDLENTTVSFETGPVGVLARIDHPEWWRAPEFAGPLSAGTIIALFKVSR